MEDKAIQLTGVFVEDPKTKRLTAFFAQFSNIIAEGDNEEDAAKNLIRTVKVVFENQKNNELNEGHASDFGTVTTKPFNFEMA